MLLLLNRGYFLHLNLRPWQCELTSKKLLFAHRKRERANNGRTMTAHKAVCECVCVYMFLFINHVCIQIQVIYVCLCEHMLACVGVGTVCSCTVYAFAVINSSVCIGRCFNLPVTLCVCVCVNETCKVFTSSRWLPCDVDCSI